MRGVTAALEILATLAEHRLVRFIYRNQPVDLVMLAMRQHPLYRVSHYIDETHIVTQNRCHPLGDILVLRIKGVGCRGLADCTAIICPGKNIQVPVNTFVPVYAEEMRLLGNREEDFGVLTQLVRKRGGAAFPCTDNDKVW